MHSVHGCSRWRWSTCLLPSPCCRSHRNCCRCSCSTGQRLNLSDSISTTGSCALWQTTQRPRTGTRVGFHPRGTWLSRRLLPRTLCGWERPIGRHDKCYVCEQGHGQHVRATSAARERSSGAICLASPPLVADIRRAVGAPGLLTYNIPRATRTTRVHVHQSPSHNAIRSDGTWQLSTVSTGGRLAATQNSPAGLTIDLET